MSESSSSQQQQTSQADNRMVLGEAAMVAQGGSSIVVNSLDATVANHALDTSVEQLKTSLNFASKSQGQALDSLNTTANLVKDAYADAKGRGALTDKILIGAIAMAGIVAFAAVRK